MSLDNKPLWDEKKITEYLSSLKEYEMDDNYYEFLIADIKKTKIKNIVISRIRDPFLIGIFDDIGSFFYAEREEGSINRCWTINAEEWDKNYSVNYYCEQILEYINMNSDKYNIKGQYVEGDGRLYNIWYYAQLPEKYTIEESIFHLLRIEEEIVSYIDLSINKHEINSEYLRDEAIFSKKVLLPLFREMDFDYVAYNHGKREFGKDIILSITDKFGLAQNYGVQVKKGNMSGEANSELDKIIGQIDDAFLIPFIDKYNKKEKYVNNIIIIISGRFTDNATEKILRKSKMKNILFFDIDKIQELIVKHM